MSEGKLEPIIEPKKVTPMVRTFNVILQKVIQVDKPTEYYKDREKMKIFIY